MLGSLREAMADLGGRYGPAGAAAILVCTALLAAVPLPGTCLLPLCVAELTLKAKG